MRVLAAKRRLSIALPHNHLGFDALPANPVKIFYSHNPPGEQREGRLGGIKRMVLWIKRMVLRIKRMVLWIKRMVLWIKRMVLWIKRMMLWTKRMMLWTKRMVLWTKRWILYMKQPSSKKALIYLCIIAKRKLFKNVNWIRNNSSIYCEF